VDNSAVDTNDSSAAAQPGPGPTIAISRVALIHGGVALGLLSTFAIGDSWRLLTDLPLAGLMSVLAALFAGALLTTLIHEWFHYFGVLVSKAQYSRVSKVGLFVFNWDFQANSTRQFLIMSLAGTLGSVVGVTLFTLTMPADSAGRAALQAAAWGSLVFAAAIEWPVLRRVFKGGEPLAELLRINQDVLRRSAISSVIATLFAWWLIL